MKSSQLSSPCLAAAAGLALASTSAHAAIIFEASDANTTTVSNLNNGTDTLAKVAITGDSATSTLLISNTNGNFNNGGISSTDDIGTLNGGALTSLSIVTATYTVDSISGLIRSNGASFGLAADAGVFGAATDLRINLRANNASVLPTIGIGTADSFTSFNINEASIKDGFTVTLTVDVNGYAFSFSDLIAQGANPIVDITGTFSGTEFVDNFSDRHFYATTQKYNAGAAATDTTISLASIDVTTVPEPSAFALIGLSGLGLLLRRRRA